MGDGLGLCHGSGGRAAVLRVVGEELAGVPWHEDLTVSHVGPPDGAEVLS